MSDITLTVSAPGPTVDLTAVVGSSVTLTVNEGGGGGVSTHAELPDLATSGHPASVISGLGGAATKNVGTTAGTVAAGDDSRITGALSAATAASTYQPLDADLTAVAALTSPATTITGAVPKSTVTTAGDLIYGTGSAAVSRLGIGSALQVLRTNAGATAPEWATVSSGAMTLIARTVLGNSTTATVDFTSIPATYETLRVVWQAKSTGTGDIFSRLYMRFNGDSTNTYGWEHHYAAGASGGQVYRTLAAEGQFQTFLIDSHANVTANFAAAGAFDIPAYARTSFIKNVTGLFECRYAMSDAGLAGNFGGKWNSTAAVNQITFSTNTGNFVAGSVFTLYGIAGS